MKMTEEARNFLSKDRYDIDDLRKIMKMLRSEGGCPWDMEQTHKSIRDNFIEETYEVVEAIDTENTALMREELGDVLLQVVFHSQISEEDGEFNFEDVTDEICKKLIVRHPHVFGEISVNSVGDVLTNWDDIKKETKHQKDIIDVLSSVARSLPSLMRAAKLAKKAEKAGIYSSKEPVDELDPSKDDLSYNIGKKLFEIAAFSEKHGIDPEHALYDYCDQFIEERKNNI